MKEWEVSQMATNEPGNHASGFSVTLVYATMFTGNEKRYAMLMIQGFGRLFCQMSQAVAAL